MRYDEDLQLSLENIGVLNENFYLELKAAVDQLRNDGSYSHEAVKQADFSGIIWARMNMTVDFIISKDVTYNAYLEIPQIDKNHPWFKTYGFNHSTSIGALQALKMSGKKELKGWVDRKTGRVGGWFSQIRLGIVFGFTLIKDKRFSSGEIVGIILHELGHAFTYFESLGEMTRTNQVIGQASLDFMEVESPDQRVKVLSEAERQLGITINDKDKLANNTPKARKDLAEGILITEDLLKSRSVSGLDTYDVRSIEQLADQFAIRAGAGKELASAMDKMARIGGSRSALSTPTYLMIEIMKTLITSVFFLSNPISTTFFLLAIAPGPKTYDDPQARIRIMKQELIVISKNMSKGDKRRMQLLEDIEAIQKLEDNLTDRRSFYEVLYSTLSPTGRKLYKQEVFAKSLEDLVLNELYLKATQLSEMKL